jgi:hypothetical protein
MYDVRELRKLSHRSTAKKKLPKVGHIMTGKKSYAPNRRNVAFRDSLLTRQNGKCLICALRPATNLDHNHYTGADRAMLCNGCNTMLGRRHEDASLLRRLAEEARAPRIAARQPLLATRYERAAMYLDVFGHDPRRVAA